MGLPELIVTVRCESYSSIKVKSTNTFVKSKVATYYYFCFGYIAVSCLFETFPGGWVGGKSDFNENPVVSLDLDLDFDLGFVKIRPWRTG